MAKKMKKPKKVKPARMPAKSTLAWGGFVGGELTEWASGFYDVEHLTVFRSRAHARRCCQDVRRVRITVVS